MLGLLREAFRSVRFTRPEPGRFALAMRPGWVTETTDRRRPGRPRASAGSIVREWMESALIASSSRMRNIRENRVLGAAREIVVEVPELDLIAPPNVLLYRVSAEAFAIVPEDTLEIVGSLEEPKHGQPFELLLFLPARLLGAEPAAEDP